MTTMADRLFTELDRQLIEVRTTADGIATRASFLTSAAALAAGLMTSRIAVITTSAWTVTALVCFGLAAFFGIGAVAPSMYVGMKSSRLTHWINTGTGSAEQRTREIFAEKIVILEKNHLLLTIIRVMYYLQGAAVMAAIISALLAVSSGATPEGR